MLNTGQQLGAVLGVAVVSAVFGAEGGLATPARVVHGYRAALGVAAAISLAGALAALFLRGRAAGSMTAPAQVEAATSAPELAEVPAWRAAGGAQGRVT